jgi:hypothetical protein
MLEGMITPAGLHYVRNHNGTPDIDPDKHELVIFGMVKQPLTFSVDSLMRYPMTSAIHFHGMRRQFGRHERAHAAAANRGRHSRAAVVFGMDGREAFDIAR